MALDDASAATGGAVALGGLPLLSTAMSGASSILGYIGQQQTNATQQNIANQTNANSDAIMAQQEGFQSEMTSDQEAYQTQSIQNQENYATEMSDTQYQRGVADLKAAGLNPIMAATGPATSPQGTTSSGSAPSGSAAPQMAPQYKSPLSALSPLGDLGKDLLGTLNTITQMRQAQANTQLTQAQTNKTNTDIDMDSATTQKTIADTNTSQAALPETQMLGNFSSWVNKIMQSVQSYAKPDPGINNQIYKQTPGSNDDNFFGPGGDYQPIPLGPGL